MPQQPLAQVPDDAQWFWQDHGSCREADPLLFFHPQNERGSSRIRRDRAAKLVCAACPVRMECADYAVRAREPYGVWGGLSEEDRERIYARLDSRHYPRAKGDGLRAAGSDLSAAISPRALGIA
ncbi:MAG: WhiB family transcriptional regulator [Candidatus Nanopelagicales bacterium]|jgi:WhiB family transcriptional regulator, redox-sensing transcriptional regulator